MKRFTLLFIIFLLFGSYSSCPGQAPDTLWTKLFGGPGNDYGYWLDMTDDGGYIITGSYALGVGNTDICLIKTDGDGDTVWTSTYGGIYFDAGRWVNQTSDGGYIVTGLASPDNNTDWDIFIFKTDSMGTTQWHYFYGGGQEDGVVTGQPTSDDGYILAGYTASFGMGLMDAWLLKLDDSGDTLWTKTFGYGGYDSGRSAIQTPDGGYLFLCNIDYGFNDVGLTLIKTDASGDSLWSRRYCQNYARGVSIIQAGDGDYMILANTLAFGDEFDIQLLKINENGDSLWTQVIGGVDIDMGNSIRRIADDGYIICGITGPYFDQDIFLIKTDIDGYTLWDTSFQGTAYGNDLGSCARPTPDGGIIFTGSISTVDSLQDICLFRLESEQVGVESNGPFLPTIINFRNFPNPFNSSTTIEFTLNNSAYVELTVYDLLGRAAGTLLNEYRQPGRNCIVFDASSLPSGVYFYRLRAGDKAETKRMILLK